ncbi:MAG: hydroxyphenylacetyl-CoA thioesterase PaaI [Hyphomicrobiaceae bacterium]|nr:hydroxyphenylacetyl-CoA thioesterase PaaI [Hyphomicrobiaceae bacterium]
MTACPRAQAIARQCADAMWADDSASRGLGMELVDIGPGEARLAMTVTESMVNGHGVCHGGFIFTLADSAFAYACNTYGDSVVAQHCSVTFIAPGRMGMRLVADARERHRAERSGIYDIRVTDEQGTVIADFRGHSRTVPGGLLTSNSE